MKSPRYILIILIVLLTASSCSDFFDLDRPPQVPWNNVEEFERSAIGAYAGLFSGHEWNMAWVNDRLIKTNMGDDIGFVEDASFGYPRNTKAESSYTTNTFVQLYRVIATVNNALDFVQSKDGNPFPDASESDRTNNINRVVGELHFVRAYAYYVLETTFGHAYVPGQSNDQVDIPMPLSYATSAEEARNPQIATTQEVYDQIVRDLRLAKSLLPEKFDASKHHPSYQVRANRFAASAMLVRAYMQKGKYDSALMECDYIIDQNNGAYDLSEDPIQAFNKSSVVRGKEVIFYAPFYDDNRPVPSHLSALNQTWSNAPTSWAEAFMGFGTVKRIGWMTDPEGDTTLTNIAKRDKRFTQLFTVRYPVNKHLPNQAFDPSARPAIRDFTTFFSNKYYRGPKGMRTNVPLIRLAEIYLTRSWLKFHKGDAAGAADDLNIVRKRAWDEAVAGGAYSPLSGNQISEQLINDERLIEMYNEGDRLDYLRAIKAPVPKGERGPGTDPYDSDLFIWIIPSLELNFNDQM